LCCGTRRSGELDIAAYSPQTKAILHLEPSLDADTWKRRKQRYEKKFKAGRKHIRELFPWVKSKSKIRQIAIFVSAAKDRTEIAGGEVVTVDEVVHEIRQAVSAQDKVSQGAIPEQFPLLRTIQLMECGYYARKDHTRQPIIKPDK